MSLSPCSIATSDLQENLMIVTSATALGPSPLDHFAEFLKKHPASGEEDNHDSANARAAVTAVVDRDPGCSGKGAGDYAVAVTRPSTQMTTIVVNGSDEDPEALNLQPDGRSIIKETSRLGCPKIISSGSEIAPASTHLPLLPMTSTIGGGRRSRTVSSKRVIDILNKSLDERLQLQRTSSSDSNYIDNASQSAGSSKSTTCVGGPGDSFGDPGSSGSHSPSGSSSISSSSSFASGLQQACDLDPSHPAQCYADPAVKSAGNNQKALTTCGLTSFGDPSHTITADDEVTARAGDSVFLRSQTLGAGSNDCCVGPGNKLLTPSTRSSGRDAKSGSVETFDTHAAQTGRNDLSAGPTFPSRGHFPSSDIPPLAEVKNRLLPEFVGRNMLLLLDYDGTLSPIVSNPAEATISERVRSLLLRLSLSSFVTVAIVTGRALNTIKNFIQIDPTYDTKLIYAASHGFHIETSGRKIHHQVGTQFIPVLREAAAKMKAGLPNVPGLLFEDNEFAVSVHYRNVAPANHVIIERCVDRVLAEYSSLKKTFGKMVFEIRINIDWDKGRAVTWLLETLAVDVNDVSNAVIYVGDDWTDEDAFRVLKPCPNGLGVLVAEDPSARPSDASVFVRSPADVADFLADLVALDEASQSLSFETDGQRLLEVA